MWMILCCCPLQLVVCGLFWICVTRLRTIFQSFLMLLKLSACSSKPGKILLQIIRTPLAFWLAAMPMSLLAAGLTLVIYWLRIWTTRLILNIGSIHFVVKWMMFYVILVKCSLLSNYSWWKCTSFYGSVLWDVHHPAISAFCAAWRKAYGGFGPQTLRKPFSMQHGVFHTVHIAVCCMLWAINCHYLMNCVVELLCLLRPV